MELERIKSENEQRFYREFRERYEVLTAYPVQLEFWTTTRCNIRCFTCPKTYDSNTGRDSSRELFDRMAAELFPTARSINLTGFGEPMMASHFRDIFECCVEGELHIGFNTNGTYLTEEWLERFAATKTHLVLSIDAVDPAVMHVMRPTLKVDRLLRALRYWKQLTEGPKNPHSRLCFDFVATTRNVQELPAVVELAARSGVQRIEVLSLREAGVGETVRQAHLCREPELARRWFGLARRRAEELGIGLLLPPGYDNELNETAAAQIDANSDAPMDVNPAGSKYPLACSAPWFRIKIDQQGGVYPCCWYPYALGNLCRQSFDSIWNGEAFRKMRRRINTRFPHLGCKECRLCWGITAGRPDKIFEREGAIDRLHTSLQRLRRTYHLRHAAAIPNSSAEPDRQVGVESGSPG